MFEQSFETRLRISNRMICLKRSFIRSDVLIHIVHILCICVCVWCQWEVQRYIDCLLLDTNRRKTLHRWIFCPLYSAHTHNTTGKRNVKYTCHVYFTFFCLLFCFLFLTFHFTPSSLWHGEQVKRVPIVVCYFAYFFAFALHQCARVNVCLCVCVRLCSASTGPMCLQNMEKLVRIWNNFCIIEHIFSLLLLFIPILPWICHINSPHMPDTWLHLLMSDRGNVRIHNQCGR